MTTTLLQLMDIGEPSQQFQGELNQPCGGVLLWICVLCLLWYPLAHFIGTSFHYLAVMP